MNPIDIEKYKKDMMKLYEKRVPADIPENHSEKAEELPVMEQEIPEPEAPDEEVEKEEIPEITTMKAEEIPKQKEEVPNQTEEIPEPTDENDTNTEDDDITERFPEPDLSELNEEEISDAVYESTERMGNSTGYILVNVRAGRGAYPIENATVIVTAIVEGNRLIIASGVTDISGTTLKLQTPAPDIIYSQSPSPAQRPYSLFDISVRANGYFNARSVDVPVFSGITSVQNFNMIPVPLIMNSNDETLTYFNQEPNL